MGKGKRTRIERQDLSLITLEIITTTVPFSSGGKFSSEIQRQKSVGNGVEAFREKSRKHRFQIDGIATGRTNGLFDMEWVQIPRFDRQPDKHPVRGCLD